MPNRTLFGLLNVNKPTGVASRDVVDRVQRILRPTKVGHSGTLDPLAEGVLVLTIGPATRLTKYIQSMPKTYEATFLLGRDSDTDDTEGNVQIREHVQYPTAAQVLELLPRFRGRIMQRPPIYSALKVRGQRAYAMARKGETPILEPRPVHIYRLTLDRYEPPQLAMTIQCEGGTYIRALGRDIGLALGTGGVMSRLTRTAVGNFSLADARPFDALTRPILAEHLLPPTDAIRDLPRTSISQQEATELRHGRTIERFGPRENLLAAITSQGELAALLAPRDAATGPGSSDSRPIRYGPIRNFLPFIAPAGDNSSPDTTTG